MRTWVMACDGSGYLPSKDIDCPGSFGAVIHPLDELGNSVDDSCSILVGASRINTTNGQMEVAACGHGLRAFIKAIPLFVGDTAGITINIVVDAQYVYCAYNQHPTKPEQGYWMKNWISNGWRKSDNKPVENQELWKFLNLQLDTLSKMGVIITWSWVAGHSKSSDIKSKLNNRVDSLCTKLVSDLRSSRQQEKDSLGESSYPGESAWYEVKKEGVINKYLLFKK